MESVSVVEPLDAEALNRGCVCRSLDPERLRAQLEGEPSLAGLADEIAATRPNLFSATAVFVSSRQVEQMGAIVRAVGAALRCPTYRETVLARAPEIAARDPGPSGVFLGFDFHLTADGPQLIEINTNAGGAMLNGALARAQRACCEQVERSARPATHIASLDDALLAMFRREWQLQRGGAPLRSIAIVDESPPTQYLYPEFKLFERLFRAAGYRARIADPAELEWRDGALRCEGETIDLVYNRLTDFYFERPECAALAFAYRAGAAVVTPHPHAHALYADKRNLALLSDAAALEAIGLGEEFRLSLLRGIPPTREVGVADADQLWERRRGLFFKPAGGFGSRAAYRGDKLTRRVWNEILAGDYVAQQIAPPSARRVRNAEGADELKLDVRAYAYGETVQLFAARLYSGQTTNFRTPGGGFAPVYVVG